MSNLILQNNNLFSKFWIWLKKKFFNKEKYNKKENLNDNKNTIKQEVEIIEEEPKQLKPQKKTYDYVQDLDYETEKKYTVNLFMDVMNNKKETEDLDLADLVRIKLLMDD